MELFPRNLFPIFDNSIGQVNIWILIPFLAWSLLWKGLGLWFSSRNEEKYWFIALLVLNTVGILEIAYLFFFAKNKLDLGHLLKNIKI